MRIERAHAIEIPLPVATAFPLFTPKGEMAWIDAWRPRFIHPEDGETRLGMVFTTGGGAEETFWSCIEWSPEAYRVAYARVTPASRFAHVRVACSALSAAITRVAVSYEMVALSAAGADLLVQTTDASFAASIEEWRERIEARIVPLHRA